MGYPMNWTKIEPTELRLLETQSFHLSTRELGKAIIEDRKKCIEPQLLWILEKIVLFMTSKTIKRKNK